MARSRTPVLEPVRTDIDAVPSAFEDLAGVLLDGTPLDDVIDVRATIARHAEFGGVNADVETAAWLAGADI